MDLARQKGCDGIDPDNVDGFTHDTGFDLSFEDQLEFNRFLAEEAHRRSLLIALKNDPLQADELAPLFDFSVVEECVQYRECGFYLPFARLNKPVFDLEYDRRFFDPEEFKRMCEYAASFGVKAALYPKELDGSFVIDCTYGAF